MIRIAYDAKRAAQNGTGLGNYSRFVISSVYARRETEHIDMRLYCPDPEKVPFLSQLPSDIKRCFPSGNWKHFRSVWRVWGISSDLERDGIDLYHGLSNELPLNISQTRIRTVVTVHDLISVKYPQYFPWIDARIYASKIRKACRNATRIIAVSRRTKEDIVELFSVDPDKIDVVYQGCHSQFRQDVSEERQKEVRRKYALPEKFIFHLGSLEERKNLLLVVQALEHLPEDIHLVAIGKRTAYTEKVERYIVGHGLESRVHLFHKVPFEYLPAFYHSASVFVYPSRYEGFGIPLLEALCCGVPVIGATGSCLEEAGGPDSLYVDPDDAQELARNVAHLFSDEGQVRKMREKGREYASKFVDSVLIDDLLSVYRRALS